MSEGVDRSDRPEADPGQRVPAAARSAGAMLRQIRESAGIDAVVVASALKITPQMLEALEQDRYQALPDLAFARSLAASICRNFGVDPEPVLAQMPQVHTAELSTRQRGINAPFHGAGDRPMALLPKYISRPLTVVVALFLLGSLLLWLWPTLPIRLSDAQPDAATVSSETPLGAEVDGGRLVATPVAPAEPQQQPDPDPTPAPAPADEAANVDAAEEAAVSDAGDDSAQAAAADDAAAQSSAAGDDVPQDLAAAAAVPSGPDSDAHDDASAPEQESMAAATPVASDDLVIAASGESWVSVRDATGKALVNRLLEAGETVRISGDKPLSATIGRKDAVTVQVHGEPFDHLALSNSSVSRFKVN